MDPDPDSADTFTTPVPQASIFSIFFHRLNQKYEPRVRNHLLKVYMMVGCTIITATVGSVLKTRGFIKLDIMAFMGFSLIGLGITFSNVIQAPFYVVKRFGYLQAVGFCAGQLFANVLEEIVRMDLETIFIALAGTAFVFISLTISALLAATDNFLRFGSVLTTFLNLLSVSTIFNIFVRYYMLQTTNGYLAVFLLAGFTIYHIHCIISLCRAGESDAAKHALYLFVDIYSFARRLLVLLAQRT